MNIAQRKKASTKRTGGEKKFKTLGEKNVERKRTNEDKKRFL